MKGLDINYCILKHNVNIRKILHVGAHECQEKIIYNKLGIGDKDIIWIEAIPDIVKRVKDKYPDINIHQELIYSESDIEKEFNISNNEESSSILEMKDHLKQLPHIYNIDNIKLKTCTLYDFYKKKSMNINDINFLVLDLQGSELEALRGMKGEEENILDKIDYIYTEVNVNETYKGCCMIKDIDEELSKFNFIRVEQYIKPMGWGDAFYIKKHLYNPKVLKGKNRLLNRRF